MTLRRVVGTAAVLVALSSTGSWAAGPSPQEVEQTWTKMVLLLTRHTPTYSPPVASRTFAYLTIAAYEAVAAGSSDLQSLAGQLIGLTAGPQRDAGAKYDEAVVMEATLAPVIKKMFDHTGPIGQRAFDGQEEDLRTKTEDGVPADVVARSEAFGTAVAEHILDWAKDDGGADVENMGFPLEYTLTPGPAHWVPTSTIVQ